MYAANKGAAVVLIHTSKSEPVAELRCHGDDCSKHVPIAATMIGYDDGLFIKEKVTSTKDILFTRFQATSQPNYFFAIDGQGKLAEIGLFLFPSFRFLAREAQW